MFIKCGVHLLPTLNKIEGTICKDSSGEDLKIGIKFGKTYNNEDYIPHYIYITDESEIEQGDFFIELDLFRTRSSYINKVYRADIGNTGVFILTKDINFPFPENCRKIIATNDPDISVTYDWTLIPRIDDAFINEYIESYNSDNIITSILVEFTGVDCENKFVSDHRMQDGCGIVIKTDDFNNIIVKEYKQNFDKKELAVIISDFIRAKDGLNQNFDTNVAVKWVNSHC